jgi:hypothetical protein
VASIETPSDAITENTVDTQRKSAERLYSCLLDSDIPAVMAEEPNGEARVGIADDHAFMIWVVDGEGRQSGGYSDPLDSGDFEDFKSAHLDGYGLEVDGIDHSESLKECYVSSEYVEPYSEASRADEEELIQRSIEVTNDWLACAREHGYPDVVDVDAPETGTALPEAILPFEMTVDGLRSLLDACPNFDEAQIGRQVRGELPSEEFVPNPIIVFGTEEERAGVADDPVESARLIELEEALYSGIVEAQASAAGQAGPILEDDGSH